MKNITSLIIVCLMGVLFLVSGMFAIFMLNKEFESYIIDISNQSPLVCTREILSSNSEETIKYEKNILMHKHFVKKQKRITSSKSIFRNNTSKLTKIANDVNMIEQKISVYEACKNSLICIDTDGGENYSQQGQSIVNKFSQCNEICIDSPQYAGSKPGGNYLLECFCKEGDYNGNPYDISISFCENGCQEGACLKTPTINKATCKDSDNGEDIYIHGIASSSFPGNSREDQCYNSESGQVGISGDSLFEAFCDEGQSGGNSTKLYTCPNGCKDGKCIVSDNDCIDSDGGFNPNIKGIITYPNNPLNYKSPLDDEKCEGNVVWEMWCEWNSSYNWWNLTGKHVSCTDGCKNVACI